MSEVRESPRRLRAADVIEAQQETIERLTMRTATEPSATVELDTTAKGEPKPRVHLTASVGADLEALRAHVLALAEIALTAHHALTPVTIPDDDNPF